MMANPLANQKGSVANQFVQSRLSIFADGTVSGGVTVQQNHPSLPKGRQGLNYVQLALMGGDFPMNSPERVSRLIRSDTPKLVTA
jgi:hypothetical protein